jgi:hypothetical protein
MSFIQGFDSPDFHYKKEESTLQFHFILRQIESFMPLSIGKILPNSMVVYEEKSRD